MAENKEDEIIAFGMTSRQISETADALSRIKDNNHPKKTSSYIDFLAVKKAGHEKILTQENYGKIS
jgi:translation initiation factor IF-2